MAEHTLTENQRAVIEHRGGALLVSAAAGSGKTFVLVQRLLRMICDETDPCNVDDFLIITFTKAAAAELREKIREAIVKRLKDEPKNLHLRRQLTRIYLADISTVHAFCGELLRDYAYLLDISSDFVISENLETKNLQEKALDSVLAAAYAEQDPDSDAAAMLRAFAPLRDDRALRRHVLSLYEKLTCHAYPEEWADDCREALLTDGYSDVSETVWGKYLLEETRRNLREQADLLQKACDLIAVTPELDCYSAVFFDEVDMIRALSEKDSWESLRSACPAAFGSLQGKRVKGADEEKAYVQGVRNHVKDSVKKALNPYLRSSAELLADMRKMRPALCGLLDAALSYGKAFAKLKRGSRLMDYSDLEHETIRLLTNGVRGGRTEVAEEVSKRYREIMIDEYQDTNDTQDTIFQAITQNGKNLVMVGDVKQSIYRFRNADPGIFLQKYETYALNPQRADEGRKVFLSNNFRSRPEILDAANFVFSTVMSRQVGDVDYDADAALRPNPEGDYPQASDDVIQLHLIDTKGSDAPKEAVEADFVADSICELLDGKHEITDKDTHEQRPIRAEDIAILFRSPSTPAPYYNDALKARGIPFHSSRAENILPTTEVQSLIAYLRVVDNPHNDIALITALACPIGGFGADVLAAIRCENLHGDFWDALQIFAEKDQKAKEFSGKIASLRERRHWLQTEDFLDLLVRTFRFFPIFGAMRDGESRCRNLRQFLRTIRSGAKSGQDQLSAMLRRIDVLLDDPYGLSAASEDSTGCVTIMSVHSSKGLEFPVVFLCDLSRQFNMDDLKGALLVDSELYLGCKSVDTERLLTLPTTARSAIAEKLRKDGISEELRLLYVAMTRARERLIMTYASSSLSSKLEKLPLRAERPLPTSFSGSVSAPGEWILYAAALRPEAPGGLRCSAPGEWDGQPWRMEIHSAGTAENRSGFTEIAREQIAPDLSALDRSYDLRASQLPAKLTATQLKGRSPDTEIAENALPAVSQTKSRPRDRVFDPERKTLTPTEQGTAVHQFMQFCDYAACCDAEGVEREKERLLRQKFLSERQLGAVDTEKVLRFFNSELGKLVVGSPSVRREFKFSMLADAERYFPDGEGEQLLLQGVIDSYVETPEGIVILDYKTDHVRSGQEAERAEAYRPQITAYATALHEILGKPIARSCLYFIETGTAVDV